MNEEYLLDENHKVIPCYDSEARSRFLGSRAAWVGFTQLTDRPEPYVSTKFMGFSLGGTDDRPLVFESVIFGIPSDDRETEMERIYATWEEAEKGHAEMVQKARSLMYRLDPRYERSRERGDRMVKGAVEAVFRLWWSARGVWGVGRSDVQ